jgi:hypothetical protein
MLCDGDIPRHCALRKEPNAIVLWFAFAGTQCIAVLVLDSYLRSRDGFLEDSIEDLVDKLGCRHAEALGVIRGLH